jgi:hypothetical protein
MANPFANQAFIQEFQIDAWIKGNIPGGLNSMYSNIFLLILLEYD